jgi:opacity protein-like surface antigen
MKKIVLLTSVVCITNAANAYTEYYVSAKADFGDTTIYADDDTKIGDYLAQTLGTGYKYDASGFLWGISPAVGLDWSPNSMYVAQNPYAWFHLRLEGEFGYNNYREDGKLRYDYEITDEIEIKLDHFFMMANGYADFRINKVVPYFGLGIGYSFGKEGWTLSGNHEGSDSASDNGFLYGLYAGVGYKFSDITTFDLGYRRIYAPAEDDGMYVFSGVRLGARFRI